MVSIGQLNSFGSMVVVNLAVSNNRYIPSAFQELHHFLTFSRQRCPSRLRLWILLQTAYLASLKTEVDLSQMHFVSVANRINLAVHCDAPGIVEERLSPDSQ
jgi:hypothetical protein